MSKPPLTHARLVHLLDYRQDTGEFFWRLSESSRMVAGARAGTNHSAGYRRICVDRAFYYAHRLAWFYVNGELPTLQIDHINQIKTDNRITNLRAVTPAGNIQNRFKNKNITSGYKGVSRHECGNWAAEITFNSKKRYLGLYPTAEAAYDAYQSAAAVFHTHNPIAKPVQKEILQ